jgi:hypothetical protein
VKDGGVSQVLKGSDSKDLKVQRAMATCLANVAQDPKAAKECISGNMTRTILSWVANNDDELTGASLTILANASHNGSPLLPPYWPATNRATNRLQPN